MGKVLKVAAIVAAVAVAFVPGVGPALSGAIVGALGGTFTAAAIAGYVVTGVALAGIVAATSIATSLFIKKPSMDMSAALDRLNISLDPQAPGKWVFGETAAATDLVFADNGGSKKRYITQIIHLASHRITSAGELYIDGELAISAAGVVQAAWSGILTRSVNLGTESQAALNPANSLWPTTAHGYGLSHMSLEWDLKDGKDKLSGGIPTRVTQIIKGGPVYDPRLDSTRGGVGAHRADDQTTWEYANGGNDIGANWALVCLFYLLGWRVNGELLFGMGVDPDDIYWDQAIAAANVCDDLLDGKPRYRIGGIFGTSNDHQTIRRELEAAVGGRISKVGGKYFIWAPNDDLTSEGTITEDDLVRAAGVVFSPAGPIEDLYNTARGRYVDPALLYQPNYYPEIVESSAVTEDGRSRVKDHDFSIVQDQSVAERVARMLVRRSRFTASWKYATGPKGLLYRPFDVITLNIQETNDTDTLVRIIDMEYSAAGIVAMTVVEEDSSIYDTTAALGTPVTQNDPAAFDPNTKIDVTGLTAADTSIAGASGTASDWLLVSWDDPGGLVRTTEVEYRVKGTTNNLGGTPRHLDFTQVLVGPVEPTTIYEVRARHITLTGRVSDWSAWVEETSGSTETSAAASSVPWSGILGAGKPADNATSGAVLNKGWRTDDLSKWYSDSAATNPLTGSSVYSIATITDGIVGDKCIRGVNNDGSSNDFFSEILPCDPNRNYRARIWVRQPSGDRHNYLMVNFRRADGTSISGADSNATGWTSKGTYHYWQISDAVFPGGWTLYEVAFGPDSAATIPNGVGHTAAFVQIGVLGLRTGTTNTTIEIQGYMLQEVPDWYIIAGAGRPEDNATVGAPVGTTVGGVLAEAVAVAPGVVFRDTFDRYAAATDFLQYWDSWLGSGDITIAASSAAQAGGKHLSIGNNSGNDQRWLSSKVKIPFDPDKLYRMTVRVRRTAGAGSCYLGFMGWAGDKTTKVNTAGADDYGAQHWFVKSAYGAGSSYETVVGYVKGRSSGGSGTAKPDPSSPGVMHDDVRYFSPILLVNYNSVAGTTQIDEIKIEEVPSTLAAKDQATWTTDVTGSGKPADNATVGAPSGTNVGSTSATTVETGANAANNGVNSDGTIKDNKVSTDAAQVNAFIAVWYVEGTPSIAFPLSTKTEIQSLSVTKARGTDSVLDVMAQVALYGADRVDGTFYIEVLSGSTVIASRLQLMECDYNNVTRFALGFNALFSGLSAGTYTLRSAFTRSVSDASGTSGACHLKVEEKKRV